MALGVRIMSEYEPEVFTASDGMPGIRMVPKPVITGLVDGATSTREAILRCLGAASMCWEHPEGAGEFRPELATQIADALMGYVERHYVKRETP